MYSSRSTAGAQEHWKGAGAQLEHRSTAGAQEHWKGAGAQLVRTPALEGHRSTARAPERSWSAHTYKDDDVFLYLLRTRKEIHTTMVGIDHRL